MNKLEKVGEGKTILAATVAAALFIGAAHFVAPTPASSGSEHAVGTGAQRLVVVGEVLVAAEESLDGPGVSESALAIIQVDAGEAR